MFGSSCSVEGCTSRSGGLLFSGRCNFHETVATARELSPEEFDRLRTTLATTPPLTDEERRLRRVRSTLNRLEWTARDFKRAKRDARAAGATKGQIAEVVNKAAAEGAERATK